MWNKLIFTLVLLIITNNIFSKCMTTETEHIENQKELKKNEILCAIEIDKMIYYMSKLCFDEIQNKNGECYKYFDGRQTELSVSNLYGNIGSPGFKVCYALKGMPQIFKFQNEKQKIEETDRCIFSSERWVEISYLFKKIKIKNKQGSGK